MDGQTVIDAAVVAKLNAHPSMTTTKVWKEGAPPTLEGAFPYLLIEYMGGGLLNDAPYDAMDVELLVTAVSKTGPQAKTYAAYIEDALKNQDLTYSDGWVSWSSVRQTDFFTKQITLQNEQYFKVGAVYRFRASKAKG